MKPLNIYIGYDSKEPEAFHVLAHSIMTRASWPVRITPLIQDTLRKAGLYTRERGPTESTEFSLTRFLVPYLSEYEGYSVFMDCDMLCLTDIEELRGHIVFNMRPGLSNGKAVLCVKHDYTPKVGVKFLGNPQTVYPRKNWSSFMVFNNDMCRVLDLPYVNVASGLDLHRFNWLPDDKIGELPPVWNWLVGEYQKIDDAKFLHWTLGGPWFDEFVNTDHSDLWRKEWYATQGLQYA